MNEKKSWENAGYVNPYGFVSLAEEEPERKEIAEWQNKEELYTGKIVYHLETVSPLFIPDTSKQDTKDKEEHQEYEFFSYGDGIPVIPGSEVRGMVRSLYETLTNSCISFINENEVVAGVSANSTDLCIFFSPNASTTFLCLGEAPIVLFVKVIFTIFISRFLLT